MSKFFLSIYFFFNKRKPLIFLLFAIILAILGFLASRVKLQENMMQMLPHDKNSEQLADFLQNSKFSDRVVFAISQKDTLSSPDPDKMVVLADTLVARLQNELGDYVESVNYVANEN